ncbi:hypothetical protein EBA29_02073 [Bacillus velezensis]|uniref:hypothetical protein n=3 Tax=Bacillus velezensis TaxID=492670 RepID=UPI000FF8FE98|nr:hypothetical protein [Bacillus velezensis]QAR57099.1 hypothetical protein EBA29_02073 [Bacillus velezensis]
MKKLIFLVVICIGFILSFNTPSAEAKLTLDYKNVNFHMSEDSESFSMADYFDRTYDRTWLFYKFTISNAEGCTLNMKISRITLAGWVFPRSEKQFVGNYADYTAADRVEGDANRNHVLKIKRIQAVEMCGLKVFMDLNMKIHLTGKFSTLSRYILDLFYAYDDNLK